MKARIRRMVVLVVLFLLLLSGIFGFFLNLA